MSPQTKSKIGKFFNSNAFVTSLAVAVIMYWVNYKSDERKQADLEAKATYNLMRYEVLPKQEALELKIVNVDKSAIKDNENLKNETSEKFNTVHVYIADMKDDINKLENKVFN